MNYTNEIILCSDLEAFKVALTENGHYDAENDTFTVNPNLTPIVHTIVGTVVKSLSYVRNNELDLTLYPMIESLGDYNAMFADATALAKYKEVYPYDTPIEYADEDGTVRTYTRPEKIGVFA